MSNNAPDPIIDRFGRIHNNLRISVTDRCNIRCFYCMPEQNVEFLPRQELLTFEEITRFVKIVAPMGVDRIRVTGGEPLVRRDLPELIYRLKQVPGINDLAMTTNGLLLADQVEALRQAGLQRLNISLDGLREETFQRISRRSGIEKVILGIERAVELGFDKIRLNAVSIAGITEEEILPLAAFASERNLELRFIEFMPLDAEEAWQKKLVLTGQQIRQILESELGPLKAVPRTDPSQPAVDYRFANRPGKIGFINPVSEPFCSACNRIRITAEGQLRNCLFSTTEWDVRKLMREGGSDREIESLIRDCVAQKKPGHGIDSDQFQRPQKSMFQIGG